MGLRFKVSNSRIMSRVTASIDRMSPDSVEARRALFRIGTLVRNYAMDALTASGAVSEGMLRASITFDIETSQYVSRVIVHTSGRKYARIVELGGAFTDAMRRAMFASMRRRGLRPRPGKGIVQGGRYKGRPYMSPAAARARTVIVEELRGLVTGVSTERP